MAFDTLEQITAEVLINEGGFSDDPKDAGGVTNYGISLRFAAQHPEFFDLNHDGIVDRADIKALTPALAKQAYVEFFWTPAKLQLIPAVANIPMQMLDMAVNSGCSQAIKILQHAIGTLVDGNYGPMTASVLRMRLQNWGSVKMSNMIVDARCEFFDKVVAAHPEDKKFVDGWKRRAEKYRL